VPAAAVKSNYFAVVEDADCIGCGDCIDRCQMDAVAMQDDIAQIDLDRCIGCGLCVTTCPSEALRLVKKSDDKLYEPPASGMETYIRIAQERGKM
jgi:NAD-dependent dihydropyrimidine dehydrogenase PreA subunit